MGGICARKARNAVTTVTLVRDGGLLAACSAVSTSSFNHDRCANFRSVRLSPLVVFIRMFESWTSPIELFD
jgi:hypothetical protein